MNITQSNAVLFEMFTEALVESIQTSTQLDMLQTESRLDAAVSDTNYKIHSDVIGVSMTISGMRGNRGFIMTFFLCCDYIMMKTLYRTMTGEIDAEPTDYELVDCLSELMNLTIGLVKVGITYGESAFLQSSPIGFKTDKLDMYIKSGAERFGCDFAFDGESKTGIFNCSLYVL
jgi:hypothetical protein